MTHETVLGFKCDSEHCMNLWKWHISPHKCHPDAEVKRACDLHVLNFIHQSKDCSGSLVARATNPAHGLFT